MEVWYLWIGIVDIGNMILNWEIFEGKLASIGIFGRLNLKFFKTMLEIEKIKQAEFNNIYWQIQDFQVLRKYTNVETAKSFELLLLYRIHFHSMKQRIEWIED